MSFILTFWEYLGIFGNIWENIQCSDGIIELYLNIWRIFGNIWEYLGIIELHPQKQFSFLPVMKVKSWFQHLEKHIFNGRIFIVFYFGWNLLGSALSFLNPLSHILQTQSEPESATFTHFICKIFEISDIRYLTCWRGTVVVCRQLCLKLFHLNFSFSSLSGAGGALFLHINHTPWYHKSSRTIYKWDKRKTKWKV